MQGELLEVPAKTGYIAVWMTITILSAFCIFRADASETLQTESGFDKEAFCQRLMDEDFSDLFAQSVILEYGSASTAANPQILGMIDTVRQEAEEGMIESRTFTEKELEMLGIRIVNDPSEEFGYPEYGQFMMSRIPRSIFVYYRNHQVLPDDALAFLETSSWLTQEGESAFDELPKTDLLNALQTMVDPSTGKLYDGFNDENWTPFGIYAYLPPESEWAELGYDPETYRVVKMEGNTPAPVEEWPLISGLLRVVVWGETENSKLIDRTYSW
ncbi:MAG: hypothetical protein R3F46_02100 [bacterium]